MERDAPPPLVCRGAETVPPLPMPRTFRGGLQKPLRVVIMSTGIIYALREDA